MRRRLLWYYVFGTLVALVAIVRLAVWRHMLGLNKQPDPQGKVGDSYANDVRPRNKSGERDVQKTKVEIPFVGGVECLRREAEYVPRGGRDSLSVNVFSDSEGRFVRAEYLKSGIDDPTAPVERLEFFWKFCGEHITGLGANPPRANWQDVLDSVGKGVDVAHCDAFNIMYVEFSAGDVTHGSMYIVLIYGAETEITITSPEFRKARYVYDGDGKLGFLDNAL